MWRILLCNLLILLGLRSSFAGEFVLPLPYISKPNISNHFKILHKVVLESALDVKSEFKWKPYNQTDMMTWNIPNVTTSARLLWMTKRVNFVLPNSRLNTMKIRLEKSNISYQNPMLFPDIPVDQFFSLHDSREDIEASNISPEIYLAGKRETLLPRVYFDNEFSNPISTTENNFVTVHTPQIGIVLIDENFFYFVTDTMDLLNTGILWKPRFKTSLIETLRSIFYHEARHGDGHGHNLGFPHTLCPQDHDYAGRLACDDMLNGSYGISAFYLRKNLEVCELPHCNEFDKEIMMHAMSEAQNRVLIDREIIDQITKEKIYALENTILELTMQYMAAKDQSELDEISAKIYAYTEEIEKLQVWPRKKTVILDPKPEHIFYHPNTDKEEHDEKNQ